MEDLKTLKTKRGQIKSKLTRFRSYIESGNTSQLKSRFKDFESLLSIFDEIQNQIEVIEEDLANQDDEREIFENSYYELVTKAEEVLSTHSNLNSQSNNNNQKSSSLSSTGCSVKLPSINLPTFSGNYEDWIPFYDLFQSLVHNNESLSDVEKFHYLKTSLHDTVKPILSSLEASSQNYSTAWLLLKERYDNKRIIINKHIGSLFNIEPIVKENASDLRSLLDSTNKHLRCLKGLGQPTDKWDTILIYILSKKLDCYTLKHWETQNTSQELPSMQSFLEFLNNRCQILEAINQSKVTNQPPKSSNTKQGNVKASSDNRKAPYTMSHVSTNDKCNYCSSSSHRLFRCSRFLAKTSQERLSIIKDLNLCTNCLNKGHNNSSCVSGTCRICSKRHNTLLHVHIKDNVQPQISTRNKSPPNKSVTTDQQKPDSVLLASKSPATTNVLLSTAVITVQDRHGNNHLCRALLDNGSQTNFITNNMVQLLRLKKSNGSINVSGINNMPSHTTGSVTCKIASRCTSYMEQLEFQVIPTITQDMPTSPIDVSSWELPPWVHLADPTLGRTGPVDMLLGGEVFLKLLSVGQFVPAPGAPILQKSLLGWIAGGKVTANVSTSSSVCFLTTTDKLHSQIRKFWEIEEITDTSTITSEGQMCEEHYKKTTTRNEQGRYIVSLPLKENINEIGETYKLALNRLQSTEKKLKTNPQLRAEYNSFMKEYVSMNHMEPLQNHNNSTSTFYLPHLPIIREDSSSTKLRVVFDASARSSTGVSLNDTMRVGPTIQGDLFSIMFNFRTHRYAITADITKMYRQVLLSDQQCDLQRILWRFNPDEEVCTYRLKTVTYGMASAPFLAIRTLHQLANDEGHKFPQASRTLKEDFYVDDMMTGADNLEDAVKLRNDIQALLRKGGFELNKWNANHSQLLESLSGSTKEFCSRTQPDKRSVKVLGMYWNSSEDFFHFIISTDKTKNCTKRAILSEIAGLFDPLGLVGPVILTAKIFLQSLWALKLGWDESLPQNIHQSWTRFRAELPRIEDIRVPRQTTYSNTSSVTIHGFSDASTTGYGACIYVRNEDSNGQVQVTLLCSKSRVAPLKKQTIPRLELCGALLLAKLLSKIRPLKLNSNRCFLWSDSSIVLAWIKSEPSTWKVFVSNRVQEIQKNTADCTWRHVGSKDNPADLVSRGLMPGHIINNKLWWHGPSWLSQPMGAWPIQEEQVKEVPERRKSSTTTLTLLCKTDDETAQKSIIIHNFSSMSKLQRVTAYCFRFIHNCRTPSLRCIGPLKSDELRNAMYFLIKTDQEQHLSEEINSRNSYKITKPSNLKSLQPFLDDQGILRVGGRLDNAQISYDQKHPIILPAKSHLANLIIEREHKRTLHAGPQLTLASLKSHYWPLGGRNAVRRIIRRCVRCFKANPSSCQPLMGNLPRDRITSSRPFLTTGIDYCGPVYIKASQLRNAKLIKSYIAVFVCFSTKAIHLELVSDLSTEAFLGAFRRFTSRRGLCKDIYSDNGTNFVGAYREIQEVRRLLQNEDHRTKVINATSPENINWHFIPPNSPHFGGLWEAGVKSVKHHLKRVVRNANLIYEHMYTVLTMVEACLNSRPLTPISTSPTDPNPLTPGHFLTGEALLALPEPDWTTHKGNRLSQWQRLQQLSQHFWSRWSKEYLSLIQQRSKWSKESTPLQVGQLVIVREDNLPPLKWITGRVSAVHPGPDGKVRVATIATPTGILKRAANRLCVLPISDQDSD